MLETGARPGRGVVELDYVGRLGNRLALHCIGRSLATALDFQLQAEAIAGFPGTQLEADSQNRDQPPAGPEERITNRHRLDLSRLLADRRPRRIFLSGPFLRYEYFRPHKDRIRNQWLVSALPNETFAADDLTIHIRTGDVWQTAAPNIVHPEYHTLPFSFYAHVIKQRRWARVFVVAEHPDDPMVQALVSRRGAIPLHGTALDDFARLRASQNIVLSVSSFSWWAAWLSNAQRIFFPLAGLFDPARARRRPWHGQQSLWVNDEPRYAAIKPICPLLERDWQGSAEDRRLMLKI
jgi:hypothetical protein